MMNLKTVAKALLLLSLAAGGTHPALGGGDELQEARQALQKGEVRAAVITLKSLLQDSPQNAEARLLLGETYLRLGDGDSAAKELEKARELNAPKEKWIAHLAQAYLLQNKPKDLLEKLQPDAQLPGPVNASLQASRGMAELSLKDEAKARESFNAALQADPNSAEALLGLATIEASHQQYKQSADYALQATAKAPKNAQAWVMLGEIRRAAGDLPASLDAYSHAAELQPGNLKAWLGRASVHIATSKLQDARQDIERAKKLAPASPLVLYTDALIDFQSGKLDEAKENLVKVNTRSPEHVPTLYLLGAIAYQKNENEQAEYYLSKVIASAPGYLPAVKLLAAVRLKRGSPAEAIDLIKPWADKDQKDAQLLSILGSAYLKNKQYDQGVAYLSKAAEIAPNVAAVRAELGLGRIAAGKMEQGVDDLKAAVSVDPNLMEADATIVLALIQQKKFDEAIDEATKLKAKRKDDPLGDNLLGAAYMAKGDKVRAKESWQSALAAKPDYTPAILNLAKLAMGEGKPGDAALEYEKILGREPGNLSALIGMAQVAELKKDYVKMANMLDEARKKNPKELIPSIMLTRYYLSQGKGTLALQVASDAVSNNPDNPGALQNLGMAQMGADQAGNAATTFRQLISKFPENAELHHLLAQTLFKLGDKTGAGKEWDEALKRSPEYIPAMLAKAEMAMQDKRYGEVAKTADIIKSKYPKSPLGYQLEGDVQIAQKLPDKAFAAYAKAYELAPSSYLARRLFAVRRELKQDQAAMDGLKQWLEKSPKDFDAWGLLASNLQEMGKSKEAVAAYEKAYELHPDNILLLNNLAWLYQELGDKKALGIAEKLASTPGIEVKPEVMDTIGWIFLQSGKIDKGLVLLQQAVLQDAGNAHIRYHLAVAFAKAGKTDDAKKELERLLKDGKPFAERAQAEQLLKGL